MKPGQDADALVAAYALKHFQENGPYGEPLADHMAECPQTRVPDSEARDGTYGCDTGCDYVSFTADLSCPHHEGVTYEHEFGDFGELSYILEDLAGS